MKIYDDAHIKLKYGCIKDDWKEISYPFVDNTKNCNNCK